MIRFLFIQLFLFIWFTAVSQVPSYPQNYFRWPLDLPPGIVANMGELRPNHWHMGLDVRTNQSENQVVKAAAEGYIAHVGIRPQSFGRFIIINHPNGLSTLYGHLNDFAPELEAYVTAQQYKQESWAIELDFDAQQFPVAKGQFIAYSGNTGGSQGPHVHFEIRDTRSDKCLNPLLFGFPLTDNMKPVISKLAMYDRTKTTYYQSPRYFAVKNTDTGYIIPKLPVMKVSIPRISFALQAYDVMNGSSNQDGIYSASVSMDDEVVSTFVIDSIDYAATAYLNAQIDYPLRYRGGGFLQHLSPLPGDHAGVYHPKINEGIIVLPDTLSHNIHIEIADARQNKSVMNFVVQYDGSYLGSESTASVFVPNRSNAFTQPEFEITMPESCLYDTVLIRYSKSTGSALTAAYTVNDGSIPVQDNLTVKLKPIIALDPSTNNKIILQRTDSRSRNNKKASVINNWITSDFGDFGKFQAFIDNAAPTINELGRGDTINLSSAGRIIFTPADNFGIKSFRATLDGQWLRFTNDKGRSWIYTFDERVPFGTYQLNVTVEDLVGNSTSKSWWFKRGPYTAPVKRKPGTKKKATGRKKVVATKKSKAAVRKKKN